MATMRVMHNEDPTRDTKPEPVDIKFEVVVIPVTDVDRSKAFYTKLGWRLDADFPFDNGFRVVQFTPPGSGCSVQFGTKITTASPGSAQGLYLIVADIELARQELADIQGGDRLSHWDRPRDCPVGQCRPSLRRVPLAVQALGDRLLEAEINPLFVLPRGRGVLAADGLVVLADEAAQAAESAPASVVAQRDRTGSKLAAT